jgi:hypothetical protein
MTGRPPASSSGATETRNARLTASTSKAPKPPAAPAAARTTATGSVTTHRNRTVIVTSAGEGGEKTRTASCGRVSTSHASTAPATNVDPARNTQVTSA